jgi:hypothetical protein
MVGSVPSDGTLGGNRGRRFLRGEGAAVLGFGGRSSGNHHSGQPTIPAPSATSDGMSLGVSRGRMADRLASWGGEGSPGAGAGLERAGAGREAV